MQDSDASEIRRLKRRYCDAIDAGRYEEWAGLFTDDGRFVRGSDEAYEGYDELYAFASEAFDPLFETVAHMVTNPLIEVDGDTATGSWYLQFLYETPDGASGWSHARYEDTYRRVDDAWKITETIVVPRIEG